MSMRLKNIPKKDLLNNSVIFKKEDTEAEAETVEDKPPHINNVYVC